MAGLDPAGTGSRAAHRRPVDILGRVSGLDAASRRKH
jgi:hypothetical protein